MEKRDYYQVLGVERNADAEEIKRFREKTPFSAEEVKLYGNPTTKPQ